MPKLAKLIARNQTLKQRAVVPAYRTLARGNVFYPPPRVFANSFPKAGTHLLASLLGRLPRMMASGLHRDRADVDRDGWEQLAGDLGTVRNGQYATGHFPHDPRLVGMLGELEFASLVCLRDPRDIAVSAVGYVMAMQDHDLHRRFTVGYRTFGDRLLATIAGFQADELGRGQEDIGTRIGRYLAWAEEPGVLIVRFEDLVGPSGGGSTRAQRDVAARVADHVSRPLQGSELDRVCAQVWSRTSSTFAAGRTGGWRKHFAAEHTATFKRVCGQQLIDLGYERDLDW
jgi:hypothetical protein